MAQRRQKTILFLCTGNYFRSRFAEILFNSVAAKVGLPWRASSRGLALERGVNNIGTMSISAVKVLGTMGLHAPDAVARFPLQVTADDLKNADFIVALKQAEHLPLLQKRFPAWTEKVEFWHVDDAPESLVLIEREIMNLTAHLIAGGKRQELSQQNSPEEVGPREKKEGKKTSGTVVRVGRETKGRRGKGVTTISDIPFEEAGLLELAGKLKHQFGTGGTVKDGRIEIQGDQREGVVAVLEGMGYQVKRVGG